MDYLSNDFLYYMQFIVGIIIMFILAESIW